MCNQSSNDRHGSSGDRFGNSCRRIYCIGCDLVLVLTYRFDLGDSRSALSVYVLDTVNVARAPSRIFHGEANLRSVQGHARNAAKYRGPKVIFSTNSRDVTSQIILEGGNRDSKRKVEVGANATQYRVCPFQAFAEVHASLLKVVFAFPVEFRERRETFYYIGANNKTAIITPTQIVHQPELFVS
jgi:hypothetical protein